VRCGRRVAGLLLLLMGVRVLLLGVLWRGNWVGIVVGWLLLLLLLLLDDRHPKGIWVRLGVSGLRMHWGLLLLLRVGRLLVLLTVRIVLVVEVRRVDGLHGGVLHVLGRVEVLGCVHVRALDLADLMLQAVGCWMEGGVRALARQWVWEERGHN